MKKGSIVSASTAFWCLSLAAAAAAAQQQQQKNEQQNFGAAFGLGTPNSAASLQVPDPFLNAAAASSSSSSRSSSSSSEGDTPLIPGEEYLRWEHTVSTVFEQTWGRMLVPSTRIPLSSPKKEEEAAAAATAAAAAATGETPRETPETADKDLASARQQQQQQQPQQHADIDQLAKEAGTALEEWVRELLQQQKQQGSMSPSVSVSSARQHAIAAAQVLLQQQQQGVSFSLLQSPFYPPLEKSKAEELEAAEREVQRMQQQKAAAAAAAAGALSSADLKRANGNLLAAANNAEALAETQLSVSSAYLAALRDMRSSIAVPQQQQRPLIAAAASWEETHYKAEKVLQQLQKVQQLLQHGQKQELEQLEKERQQVAQQQQQLEQQMQQQQLQQQIEKQQEQQQQQGEPFSLYPPAAAAAAAATEATYTPTLRHPVRSPSPTPPPRKVSPWGSSFGDDPQGRSPTPPTPLSRTIQSKGEETLLGAWRLQQGEISDEEKETPKKGGEEDEETLLRRHMQETGRPRDLRQIHKQ
ncbi:hypothetical protein EMWEY_00050410 [Eimeria maxima]|uniref:Uncharacterized protein n=1 Tax=Eimeria maxima TaxID=5804 RepID=U6M2D9_EIMMA|nr:hypothetical protein EMWEY_00050410 [Eimeria maxima]CDJ58407.1 hypothetical protein EMWEY_00050410 [Eimeria maxima]